MDGCMALLKVGKRRRGDGGIFPLLSEGSSPIYFMLDRRGALYLTLISKLSLLCLLLF
jgi:hypothetical protein